MWRSKILYLFLLSVLLQTHHVAIAQNTSFPVNRWAKKLEAKDDIENKGLLGIWSAISKSKDSADVYACFKQLENTGTSNAYFRARLSFMKAAAAFRLGAGITKLRQLCEQALHDAYTTDDDYFIAYICWTCGQMMQKSGEIELGATYYLKTDEILSPLQQKPSYAYILQVSLGEMLFHTHDYEKCIEYTKKGLANDADISNAEDHQRIRYWNTIGQAYQQLGQLDSAMTNYGRSMQLAEKMNDTTWRGVNSGCIGQVCFLRKEYAKARSLLIRDYNINHEVEPNVAAFSLQWLAKIDLIQGDRDSALVHIRESLRLLRASRHFVMQKINYLQYAYYTAADVFRELGKTDSFYCYNQLYGSLHDSLERVVTLGSIKLAQLRIDNEKNYQTIQQLNRQEEAEKLTRNFVIAFLIALSVIVILILNRQKQKLKYKEQLALQEKAAAKIEAIAAQDQLKMFTQNMIEKSNLIEKLEQRIQQNEFAFGQKQLIDDLLHQTILTESDWEKFKTLFEKIHPGFFLKLKEKVADITTAELRLAALTRLHLNTKQIAAILAISPNSVNKTRQRMRQRFQLHTDSNMKEFIIRL
jgi:DNA-binding CsgD family transcriptional regulator